MQALPRPCPRPAVRARPRPSSRGVTALVVVVVIGVLLIFVALAVDVARIVTSEQHLRAAADAAALAGAAIVKEDAPPYTLTRETAAAAALQNRVGHHPVEVDPTADVEIGRWDTSEIPAVFVPFDPGDPSFTADAVRVRARQDASKSYGPLPMTFGQLAGVTSVSLAEFATAQRAPRGNPYILVLHPTKHGALLLLGNVELKVENGVIQVNSSDACGLKLLGTSAHLSAALTRVVGAACYAGGTVSGHVQTGVEPIPDPLAGLPYPDLASMPLPAGASGQIDGSQGATPWQPGYYPNGISLSTGNQAILAPGVYAIGANGSGSSKGMVLTGGRLEGEGVTLFIDLGGRVQVGGNADVFLTAPSAGTYEGVTLFHHRQNSQSRVCELDGFGAFEMQGTIYVAGGRLDIGGTPGKEIGGIVVNELQIAGNSGFVVTGKGLPAPSGDEYVFLVE